MCPNPASVLIRRAFDGFTVVSCTVPRAGAERGDAHNLASITKISAVGVLTFCPMFDFLVNQFN